MAHKFLLIQTAFIGDAILASSMAEAIHGFDPDSEIHILVRSGNEGIFEGHPFLKRTWTWNKKKHKYLNLVKTIAAIRGEKFNYCINLQRFGSTGLLTLLSGAGITIGFDKNPFSRFFRHRVRHAIEKDVHEINRNICLLEPVLGKVPPPLPRLYPGTTDHSVVTVYQQQPYVCMAPASVWFTKQWPAHKWVELCNHSHPAHTVYLLGSKADHELCESIRAASHHPAIHNLCGKLSLLQSAALQQKAVMNYVNDSAPMHLCSAVNAPVTAIYCSTVPEFGFGPLSDLSRIAQHPGPLECRPCGLHGYKICPKQHFRCAEDIPVENVLYRAAAD